MTPLELAERFPVLAAIWVAGVGLLVGSFLNVCIWRLPRDESVVSPRSRCPRCGAPIRWYQNVPLVSWVALGGRCAACRAPISWRYPAVEALNAGVWLALVWRFGFHPVTFILLPFASAMIVLFFTDWDHQILPDAITLPLVAIGIALAPWNERLDFGPHWIGAGTTASRLAAAVVGAAVGYGSFFALVLIWRVVFDREAMGGGDLKMMLGVGAFLGLPGVVATVFGASLAGTALALPFLLAGRWESTRQLPFGCFLAPAAVAAAMYGLEVVRWYLGLVRV